MRRTGFALDISVRGFLTTEGSKTAGYCESATDTPSGAVNEPCGEMAPSVNGVAAPSRLWRLHGTVLNNEDCR